jgi:hypothetical protein
LVASDVNYSYKKIYEIFDYTFKIVITEILSDYTLIAPFFSSTIIYVPTNVDLKEKRWVWSSSSKGTLGGISGREFDTQ